MNKQEVQQRVLKDGRPLPLDQFTWDEKTRTFSSDIDGLVLDFTGIESVTFTTGSDCTFKTDSYCTFTTGPDCTFTTGPDCTFTTGPDCTFKTGWRCTFTTGSSCTFKTGWRCTFTTGWNCTFTTGSDCTFKTSYNCTFTTGSDCTFKTGSDCTFTTDWNCTFTTGSDCTFTTGSYCTFTTGSDCTFTTDYNCTFTTGINSVIVRRDMFEVIQPEPNVTLQVTPPRIPGYVSNGIYSVTGKPSIIADRVLSEVVKKKGNVYHVINHGESVESYLVTDGTNWSHGETLKEAKDSLIYKLSDRDTTFCKDWNLNERINTVDLIKAYRAITGACESQTRAFCESQKLPKQMTPAEAIKLTQGQYNASVFAEFFGSKKSTKEVTL